MALLGLLDRSEGDGSVVSQPNPRDAHKENKKLIVWRMSCRIVSCRSGREYRCLRELRRKRSFKSSPTEALHQVPDKPLLLEFFFGHDRRRRNTR